MASTPQVAALGRRSSNRLTVVILVLIAVVVIVGRAFHRQRRLEYGRRGD